VNAAPLKAPAARPSRSLKSRLLDGWDRAALYLPLLLMGALALGTYWLVRKSPQINAAEPVREVRHEADYFMRRFSIRNFDETGRLKSEIFGLEGRHFPDTDILEIDDARIRNIAPDGSVTVATGKRAYSNSDASEVQLVGNARVLREAGVDTAGNATPRLEFRGEFLHAFINEERVTSHKPVVLIRGDDQFTSDAFDYSNLSQVAELRGRVRGVLMPRQKTASAAAPSAPAAPIKPASPRASSPSK
jgi:lipopolysaccharide export system protein LptC